MTKKYIPEHCYVSTEDSSVTATDEVDAKSQAEANPSTTKYQTWEKKTYLNFEDDS